MSKNSYSRRNFMKLSTAAVGSAALASIGLPEIAKAQSPTKKRVRNNKVIRLGFVGIGGRGSYHLSTALGIEGVEVVALCETKPERLNTARQWVEEAGQPTPRLYDRGERDFIRLCEEEDLDAVICSTPWDTHAAICLSAMRNGMHAACEVPLVQTVEEAWELVETYEKTGKWASIVIGGFGDLTLLNMVRKGLLGEILHVESGYIHDLRKVKFDPAEEPWRLDHAIKRNGNLYPDHPMRNMMPALDINHGDRFDHLVSMSTKAMMINDYAKVNYGKDSPYATMKTALGDYNATLIRTVNGKMVTLNHDTHTPHPRENFRIQGSKGIYLRDNYLQKNASRIYVEGRSPQAHQWEPADKYLEEYQHPINTNYNPPRRTQGAIRGHGSNASITPINWHRLIEALREDKQPDWDVYDSVTSSVISPLTEMSVANNSKTIDFPDFTKGKWKERKPLYT